MGGLQRWMRGAGRALLCLILLAAAAQAAADPAHPDIRHWRTENGLRVYYVHVPDLPMVDLRLVFDAGAARDGDRPGLARLTNRMLTEGAGGWDADAVARRLDAVGARLGTDSRRDMAVVSLRSLTRSEWLDQALETFIAVAAQPRFGEEALERARRQSLVALDHLEQDPGGVAQRAFYRALYEGHPYGHMPVGTREALESITRADLQAFHARHYVARNGILVMVGDLSPQQARSVAGRIARALPEGVAAPPLPPAPVIEEARTVRIPFPSAQAHVLMGQPGMRRGDADYFPLYVGNHHLGGGGFVSRLMQAVRSERGLAYSVYSHFIPMAAEGPFLMGLQTRGDQAKEAVAVMRRTLETFVEEGLDEAQLKASQRNIVGGFPLRLDSNAGILDHVAMIGFYGLPLDYLETFTRKVEALTPEQVNGAFARRLHPERMVTVIVGGGT
ncbi:M16 family metallopeptidase [Ectothiorhodospira mobilis]|uniref:M16 family metallopeptidase n=1 Tax=Ectothiorhodospira mobilis TaxID=195064 RepID=UPI001EE91864|nr:pitrilysin family protein [Ectothiorhodospira mobilis]MCG5534622.1 insulinase family protein [Ectothiorhodospira mobilis]